MLSGTPTQLGPYAIEAEIGRGGMGVVYRARRPGDGTPVAVKTVRAQAPSVAAAIRREVHALSRVVHPGLIRVLGHGIDGSTPWYAMELLRGRTFRELLDVPSPLAGRIDVVRDLCSALAALHAGNIVHRDLKPENVFVCDDGRVVLMDLGLAQPFPGTGHEELGADGTLGTVAYASPEQLQGGFVDARSDLYSLGCVLYECLTGRPPFVSTSLYGLLYQHLNEHPAPPASVARGVPDDLGALTLRLLAKRPRDRIGYAVDVARALAPHGTRAPDERGAPTGYLYRAPLVGRGPLVDRLARLADAVARGAGGVLALTGESGAGKTRLALEALALAQARRIQTVASGGQPGGGSPLGLFRPAFQLVAGRLVAAPPQAARALSAALGHLAQVEPALAEFARPGASLPPDELGARGARERLLRAAVDALLEAARVAPLVLVLDDVQWADELSVEVLHRLAAADLGAVPLAVVAAWRADEEPPALERLTRLPGVEQHAVGRLDAEGVGEMIAGMLALDATPAPLRDPIHARTNGNPLFVAEYLRAAMSQKILRRDPDGTWALRPGTPGAPSARAPVERLDEPASVRALIVRRLDGLDATARQVVEACAVVGRACDEAVVRGVLDVDDTTLLDALVVLRRREVLEEHGDGQLRFVHDRVRDAALDRCDPDRRRALHRRAAEALLALRGDDEASQDPIGRHWLEAGEPSLAAPCFARAAERARAAYANADAAEHYEVALACLAAAPSDAARGDHARLAERLADLRELMGQHEAARAAYDEALAAAEGVARARLLRKRAKTWEPAHRHAEALADYDAAMAALGPPPDAPTPAWWDEWLATQVERVWVHYWLAQVDAMAALVERVRPAVEAHGGPALRSRLYQAIVHQELRRGRYRIAPDTVALARAAVACADALPDLPARAYARFLLGCVLTFSGAAREGAAALEGARAAAVRTGDVTLEVRALTYLATAHRLAGDVAPARSLADAALRLAARLGMQDYVGVARANLGWAWWREGALDEARAELAQALAAWASLAGKYPYPMQWIARLPLVALCAAAGDDDAARAHAEAMCGPVQHLLPARLMEAIEARALDDVVAAAREAGYL